MSPSPDARPDPRTPRRLWLGGAVALTSALCFAFNLSLVPIAYAAGTNPDTVNLVRFLGFLGALFAWLAISGGPLSLPPKPRRTSLLLGLLVFGEVYGLLAAVAFIPVGITVLIFYTYPLGVAALGVSLGRERVSWPRLLAMLTAFAGLALVLEARAEAPDWRGVAFAGAGAALMAALAVGSEATLARHDGRTVMLHMIVTATAITAGVTLAGASLAWPTGGAGWLALAGTASFFVIATFCLFTAIGLMGPLRTAVIDTSAPVWALLFAWAILGEGLSAAQAAGAAVVILAIAVVQATGRPLP